MKIKLFIGVIVAAAITIALVGWAVQGLRWTLTGGWSSRRARLATA
jgi:hypothetical protein